jgi:hypothetical protein
MPHKLVRAPYHRSHSPVGFVFIIVKEMDVFFNRHSIRYFFAYIIFAVCLFGEELKELIFYLNTNPKKENIFIEEMRTNFVSKL